MYFSPFFFKVISVRDIRAEIKTFDPTPAQKVHEWLDGQIDGWATRQLPSKKLINSDFLGQATLTL